MESVPQRRMGHGHLCDQLCAIRHVPYPICNLEAQDQSANRDGGGHGFYHEYCRD